jgi:hypothetical protein
VPATQVVIGRSTRRHVPVKPAEMAPLLLAQAQFVLARSTFHRIHEARKSRSFNSIEY